MANNEAPAEFNDFEIQQDLNDVQAWGGESRPLIPAGEYKLTVVHVEQKPSSNNNPMVAVTFEVADEGEFKGSKVWNNYPLTEKAMGRIKALVVACGGSLDRIRGSELMGATIEATVIHTEGAAKIDQDGNPLPTKVFANVINERAIEQAPAPQKAAPTPPVQRGTQQKPANGAGARRT